MCLISCFIIIIIIIIYLFIFHVLFVLSVSRMVYKPGHTTSIG
ncbi:hypothetical protein ACMBCM_07225 [Spiroplasma sp. K1]